MRSTGAAAWQSPQNDPPGAIRWRVFAFPHSKAQEAGNGLRRVMTPNPTVRKPGKPGRPKGIPKTGGGSRKGVPNKATVEFRQAVTKLLDATQDNMIRWLTEVAEGTGEEGGKPNPAKALELMASLAEFAAPKLARTEHVGDGGGDIKSHMTVTFVRPKPADE